MKDMVQAGVLDLFLNRQWGMKLACDAACTVLRVDQVRDSNALDKAKYYLFCAADYCC